MDRRGIRLDSRGGSVAAGEPQERGHDPARGDAGRRAGDRNPAPAYRGLANAACTPTSQTRLPARGSSADLAIRQTAFAEWHAEMVRMEVPAAEIEWLAAQCWTESRWRPHAVSPVGAEGVCQFMPRNASRGGRAGRTVVRRCAVNRLRVPSADAAQLQQATSIGGSRGTAAPARTALLLQHRDRPGAQGHRRVPGATALRPAVRSADGPPGVAGAAETTGSASSRSAATSIGRGSVRPSGSSSDAVRGNVTVAGALTDSRSRLHALPRCGYKRGVRPRSPSVNAGRGCESHDRSEAQRAGRAVHRRRGGGREGAGASG